jgi:peroxiredoxin/uncharacterized membrane protein YphA (DoxX/SURF4 family)
MDTALVLARLLLAGVFVVAGIAKLLDRQGSRQAVIDFGVPVRIALPVAILLPIAELVVAVLLLFKATAWYGGIGASVLLLAFLVAIAISMARGKHPDCHCFGQLHSEPAGWPTLIRNAVLTLVALFVATTGHDLFSFSNEDAGYSLFAWLGRLTAWELAATIIGAVAILAIIAEGWLLVHLLGQNGRLLLRLDALETMVSEIQGKPSTASPATAKRPAAGLPEGTSAPAFKLEGLFGETITLDSLRAAGKPVLLIFADPGCGPCNALMPDIARWQREHAAHLTVAVVSRGSGEANRAKAREHGLVHVLLQRDREVAQSYQAFGTPSAVLVNADGTIGSPVAGGAEAIRQLVTRTTNTLAVASASGIRPATNGGHAPAASQRAVLPSAERASAQVKRPAIGEPAPPISLPDLEGNTVSLEAFQGDSTVVLFWNPGCGFCRRMVDDLRRWEASPPHGAPKLLIVSTGTVEANRELGLTSTTLLDQGFQVGRSYGAGGTPSAVLVDATGRIASDIAVGAPAVLSLLGATSAQDQPAAR